VSPIINVKEEDFDASVLKSNVPIMVHIGAPWCPPCRDLIPLLEKVAEEYAGRLAIVEVDSDQNPELASRYGAGRIPNLLFLWAGRVVRQEVGVIPYASLCQMVDELLQCASKDGAI
jgi:thioredoxin